VPFGPGAIFSSFRPASAPPLTVLVPPLAGCLDDVPPLSYDREIFRVIQKELGGEARVKQIFASIEEEPLASASIAQVHRGVLRSTGENVVLKVCKPDVAKSLRTDLDAVYLACRAFEIFDPSLEQRVGLSGIIQDAREAILAETDLEQEARNMREFRNFLERSQGQGVFADVCVPRVYEKHSTKKVLVMEELRGISLADYLEGDVTFKAAASRGQSTDALIIEALNAWIASVAACESFHADVHAGNLFVLRDGRLAFIDFGSVGRISPKTKASLESLAYCLPRQDWRGAASALVGMGAIMGTDEEARGVVDPLARDLAYLTERVDALVQVSSASSAASLFAPPRANSATLPLTCLLLHPLSTTQDMMTMDVNVTAASLGALSADPGALPPPQLNSLDLAERINRLVLDVVDIAEKRGLRFPREFALLIKQMLYFDRFVQELAPELDVLTDDRVNKQFT